MYIEVDLSTFPAGSTLHDEDDFTRFHIVLREAEHARVPVEFLEGLAGDRAADPEWRRGFEGMLAYARQHGWLDETGVRTHIERLP
jgi:hypothetical protein